MRTVHIKKERLVKVLGDFKDGRVLVVGDVMLDQFIYGTVERISPEAPVPVVAVNDELFMLGGAANVLYNIRELGGHASVCGVIGDDAHGRQAKKIIKSVKASTDGLIVDKSRITSKKTRIIAHSQQIVRFDKEMTTDISKATSKSMIRYIKANINDFDAVIISDYGKGVVTKELISEVVKICTKSNRVIIVDPKVNHFEYYKGITSMTPNHHEASQAAGIKIVDEKTLEAAGKKLLAGLESDSLLITRGENGMALFEKGGRITKIPTMARNVYDVTGAGDTVIATFTLALSVGASFKEAALLANHAAGIVVGKVGTATVTTDEIYRVATKDPN